MINAIRQLYRRYRKPTEAEYAPLDSDAVKLLLARMDSNPEDFDVGGRFADFAHLADDFTERGINQIWARAPYLTLPEVTSLVHKLREVARTNLTTAVVRRITTDNRSDWQTLDALSRIEGTIAKSAAFAAMQPYLQQQAQNQYQLGLQNAQSVSIGASAKATWQNIPTTMTQP